MDNQKKIQELQFEVLARLGELTNLLDADEKSNINIVSMMAMVLACCVSTVADLLELTHEGTSTALYKETEAILKQGGIRNIRKKQTAGAAQYSISEIKDNDFENGMNYLGQELATTLFSAIHELPHTMQNPEMLLRAVEALLANLLNQKFRSLGNVHNLLDSLCEHVHMNLKALENKVVPLR